MAITIFRDEGRDRQLSHKDAVYEDGVISFLYSSDVERAGLPHRLVTFDSTDADEDYGYPMYEEAAHAMVERQRRWHVMEEKCRHYAQEVLPEEESLKTLFILLTQTGFSS